MLSEGGARTGDTGRVCPTGTRDPLPTSPPWAPTQALWTSDGAAVMYPCHTVIVIMRLDTWEQRLFLGHTDKVGAT